MEAYFRYIIITSISITLLYTAYYFFFRKEQNLKLLRFFIITCFVFSTLLPLNKVSFDIPVFQESAHVSQKADIQEVESNLVEILNPSVKAVEKSNTSQLENTFETEQAVSYPQIWLFVHLLISSILLARMLLSFSKIMYFYLTNPKRKQSKYTLILLDKRIIPFSFFNWIFVDKLNENEELEQINVHERAHADQIHTIDLIFSELLVAAMWFNPFMWMFKRALLQVHEYLADESVLNAGYNKLEYQSLLVNQAAEDRLVAVSSNFSYSSIKKRIIMMSQTKTHGKTRFRIFILIPVVSIIIFITSGFNSSAEKVSASEKAQDQSIGVNNKAESSVNDLVKMNDPVDSEIETSQKLSEVSNLSAEELNNEQNTSVTVKDQVRQIVPNDTIPQEETSNNELIASVAPTRMNVFYIGVDNPVSIGVTGAQKGKIEVSIDNGSIHEVDNGYIVRVKQPGLATITVQVDGKVIGNYQFRVKRVPAPIAVINGKQGGICTIDELINAGKVDAIMQNFDFDLNFEVVSFNVSAVLEGGYSEDVRSTGADFNQLQIELIQKVQSGRKVYIEDIMAKGPDGTIRDLGSLTFKLE